jgi:glutamate-1-semialdehyde aminotransferase
MTDSRSTRRSQDLYRRAWDVIPGGTQLLSRRPRIFADGVAPIYATHGRGSRIFDVDGGEYLDYGMSVSACILGYADQCVNDAIKQAVDRGAMYSLNHPAEIQLAELLCELIPCAEMVRYAKGGGEANAIAVRIARGVTGRDRVLFCGYHGWHDWYLASNLDAPHALDQHLLPDIEPLGVPRALAGTSVAFPYGDLPALEQLLEAHAGQVACIIMEPMRSEWPSPGYLEGVRRLADQHNVVLIFDEVTTGFRHAEGGIQQVLGVVPDVATYAKSLSNGHAMGAVVGRRDVMEPAARMFISSTNWSDLVGISAALATLGEIRRRGVPQILAEYGARLQQQFNRTAERIGVDVRLRGLPQCPLMEVSHAAAAEGATAGNVLPRSSDPGDSSDEPPSPDRASANEAHAADDDRKVLALVAQEMAKRYVLFNAHPVHSAAHTDEDLQKTIEAAGASLQILKRAQDTGSLDASLEVSLARPLFRRLVQ